MWLATVSAADTWEYKAIAISGDTTGAWLTTNGIGVRVSFAIAAGSSLAGTANTWAAANYVGVSGTVNGVAATSDTFQITGVVVLPGVEPPSAARSPLIMRPFDHELEICKRYWQKSFPYATAPATSAGTALGESAWRTVTAGAVATSGSPSQRLSPTMRVAPTMTGFNPSAANAEVRNLSASADCSSTSFVGLQPNHFRVNTTGSVGTAAGDALAIHWTADARL
jgi:hypothetical protein